ncbi:hypothetical protein Asi02nite_21010 [Asanoa siamensis]|uniref:Uncharacterized protein n=1 Tax=Asanoa siamensis TaxID=926357 RepID=A0ABQ4CMR8_9ACTN|nr:hypothetical protein Asi02nite_21010 [Asanoa siamensis]
MPRAGLAASRTGSPILPTLSKSVELLMCPEINGSAYVPGTVNAGRNQRPVTLALRSDRMAP